MKDYYAVLGVNRKANTNAVQIAYENELKKLSRLAPAERAAQARILKEAFDTLSNPFKREDLDAHLVEIDANLGGATSSTPLVAGIVVVLITVGGVGYFLMERSKDQRAIKAEDQRAAAEREKAKRDVPARDEGKARR